MGHREIKRGESFTLSTDTVSMREGTPTLVKFSHVLATISWELIREDLGIVKG